MIYNLWLFKNLQKMILLKEIIRLMKKIVYGRGIFSSATFTININPNTSMTVNTDNANIPLGNG